MPNHLYLVRHGENWANVENIFSCRAVNRSLTPKGVLQAEQTAAYFQGRKIDRVYASPLKRATETARIIARPLGLEPHAMDNFLEVDVGSLEGQPIEGELLALYNHIIGRWLTGHSQARFPEGEDFRAVWARMQAGLEHIMAGQQEAHLILVGHTGLFNAVAQALDPTVDVEWVQDRPYYNCAVSELLMEQQNGHLQGQILTWATHAHLSGQAAQLGPH